MPAGARPPGWVGRAQRNAAAGAGGGRVAGRLPPPLPRSPRFLQGVGLGGDDARAVADGARAAADDARAVAGAGACEVVGVDVEAEEEARGQKAVADGGGGVAAAAAAAGGCARGLARGCARAAASAAAARRSGATVLDAGG